VLDVLGSVATVTGTAVRYEVGPTRPGDPAEVVADTTWIRHDLGWRPRYRFVDGVRSACAVPVVSGR
jgi:UDP-glucose 4-epimerase